MIVAAANRSQRADGMACPAAGTPAGPCPAAVSPSQESRAAASCPSAGLASPRSWGGLSRSYSSCAAKDSSLRGTFHCAAYNASWSGVSLAIAAAPSWYPRTSWARQTGRQTRRLAAHLAPQLVHLAPQPGQLVVDIPSVMTRQRTAVRGPADLAVGPVPRNLLTVERHPNGKDDGGDDERGYRSLHEEPDDRGDNQERDQHASRDGGHLEPAHPRFLSRKEPGFDTRRGRRQGGLPASRSRAPVRPRPPTSSTAHSRQ